jgi:hypothetical protein
MPLCPFCGEVFAPPADISLDTSVVFGGRCSCGAVYTCDPTGRNQGEAFMDALALASGGYQEALEIGDSDYDEVVLAYDIRKHRLIPKSYGHFSLKIAKLIFIRLNKIA